MRTHLKPKTMRNLALAAALAGMVPTLFAQQDSTETEIVLKPTFALGTGMFAFYGDVGRQNATYSPLVSRLGYELRASTPVTPWLEVGLTALHGRLGVNERSTTRNLNFESRITTGGLNVTYNFLQLLNPKRVVEPWVSIGFESVEFLTKTDLLDAQGRRYNYWSDGTIRDIAENASNAGDAVEIHRDYTYESDVREANIDGFGKYEERTWAVPVGVGVKMRLGGGFDARVGAVMHFSATDFIDGVSDKSIGERQGDAKNDNFLFTSFSVSYAVNMDRKAKKKKFKPTLSPEEMDAIAFNDDEDGDGVMDWSDHCPHTPKGVAVDANGCPLDTDLDGVPDFIDDEPNTMAGAPVNARGVTISDDEFLQGWLNYLDSGNVTFITSRVESFGPVGKPKVTRGKTPTKRAYVVKVGSQVEGISEDLIERILSLPDVRTIERGDTTFYIVGNYDALPDAIKRELQLKGQGFEGKVMIEENGNLLELPADQAAASGANGKNGVNGVNGENGKGSENGTGGNGIGEANGPVLVRVQLGAFRHRLSKNIFVGITDLVTLKDKDGLTRYYTGVHTDINEAARHKVDMLLKGFEGAFLVAFKNSKRVSIKEAGAKLAGPEDLNAIPVGTINTSDLVFRVQLGSFAGNVPVETMGKYVDLGDVKPVTSTNSVRYLYGEYPTRIAAEQRRKELQALGFTDCFVVGELQGRVISAEDAEKLLEGK
ncbi:MAG: SPOR domain-containing protein [Flavobacteriales bacterium]|nr:SPOR domain-containing protein [Flavobacteriales bacterium]